MNCTGKYEVEVIEESTGEIVQRWESKNVVNRGLIGGLFKHLFGVGNTNATLLDGNVNKTPDTNKARFGKLVLLDQNGTPTTPTSTETDVFSTYGHSASKDLTATGIVTMKSVALDTSNKVITMTIQVTFGPSEALDSQQSKTWYSMAIGDISGTSKLITRVTMGGGVTKTNTQTLRIRYNFKIQVS